MKEENIIIRFLKKLGIIKEKEISKEESDLVRRKLCNAAIDNNLCRKSCNMCAWNVLINEEVL